MAGLASKHSLNITFLTSKIASIARESYESTGTNEILLDFTSFVAGPNHPAFQFGFLIKTGRHEAWPVVKSVVSFHSFLLFLLTCRPEAAGSTPESKMAINIPRPSYSGNLLMNLSAPTSFFGSNASSGNSLKFAS